MQKRQQKYTGRPAQSFYTAIFIFMSIVYTSQTYVLRRIALLFRPTTMVDLMTWNFR